MPLRAPKGFIDETDPKVAQIGHPAPAWLVNYADLMTELVCFFVILYALSAALNKNVQKAKSDVDEMIKKGEMKGEAKVDKEGLKISLEEQGKASFFGSGSADTTAEIDSLVSKLSPTLKKLAEQHDIIVEGHTDNQRISNDYFDSNWELSTARATSVVRLMIDKYGFPPTRLAAIGYGEFRPIVLNDSPENRSKNRRVVFFIKNQTSTDAKPGMAAKAAGAPLPAGVQADAPPKETSPPADGPPTEASPAPEAPAAQ